MGVCGTCEGVVVVFFSLSHTHGRTDRRTDTGAYVQRDANHRDREGNAVCLLWRRSSVKFNV